jgi:tetratricopeptide (TPR) repeat protein
MDRTPVRVRAGLVPAAALVSLALVAALPAAAQEVSDPRAAEAIDLYDAGDYAAARMVLEELDAEGAASGTLLYRLSFCLRAAGDRRGEVQTLQRAVDALKIEVESAQSLEVPFYLANAYSNLGRSMEAREVADAATARVESGEWPEPKTPMEQFRLGKLYQDRNQEAQATVWYRRALEGFEASERSYPGNVAWARRYLGDRAFEKSDYAAAEAEFAALAAAGVGGVQALDRLAVARVKQEKWSEASDAWRKAEQADRARGDRARYCWRLAKMAAGMESLPERATEDRTWNQLSREDLEAMMKEQTDAASAAIATAGAGVEPGERPALQSRVDTAKGLFLRAALEYAARNYPIRETAFTGGFAPMIFHESRWDLPPEK